MLPPQRHGYGEMASHTMSTYGEGDDDDWCEFAERDFIGDHRTDIFDPYPRAIW